MGTDLAWEGNGGAVFVEREYGACEIITSPLNDRNLYTTERADEPDADNSDRPGGEDERHPEEEYDQRLLMISGLRASVGRPQNPGR